MRTQKITQKNEYFDSLILDIKNLENQDLTWQLKDQLPKCIRLLRLEAKTNSHRENF